MELKTIDVLCVDGSPRGITPKDIYGAGIGGAELMLMAWAKELSKCGYTIRIYNDPHTPGIYDGVEYLHVTQYCPQDNRDVLITFRGYDPLIRQSKKKLSIGWSADQYTDPKYPYDQYWYPAVDKMIGISQFHKSDHLIRYGNCAKKMKIIDIGSFEEEYIEDIPKNPYQCIWNSVPDRGLPILRQMWPTLKALIPKLELSICGSYGLWNRGKYEGDTQHRLSWAGVNGIKYHGRIERKKLVELQKTSECLLAPITYDENFMIACSENQMAGNYCVTSNQGAVNTTNMTDGKVKLLANQNNFKEFFIERTVEYFSKSLEERQQIQKEIKRKAFQRFGWSNVIKQWEEVLKTNG